MNLENKEISYIILSSNKLNDITSVLYAKDYKIINLQIYYQGQYESAILAYSNVDNDELRKDLIFILNHFREEYGIIKYLDENIANKLFKDGSEKPLTISMYNSDPVNKSYLYNGVSFSFLYEKRYWKPKNKEDFKIGMIVEYSNNNKWYTKRVENPTNEYNDIYKLLIKYDKIRIESIL
jgi:hypothetical protein